MININWDYVAGFFDGEGWVGILNKELQDKNRWGKCIRIYLSQKDTRVLSEIKDFLIKNGVKKVAIRLDSNARASYLVVSNLNDCKIILENIKNKVYLEKNIVRISQALDYINNSKWKKYTINLKDDFLKIAIQNNGKFLTRKEVCDLFKMPCFSRNSSIIKWNLVNHLGRNRWEIMGSLKSNLILNKEVKK